MNPLDWAIEWIFANPLDGPIEWIVKSTRFSRNRVESRATERALKESLSKIWVQKFELAAAAPNYTVLWGWFSSTVGDFKSYRLHYHNYL